MKYGGFGLTAIEDIAQFAFLGSWAHSLNELPIRFPSLEPLIAQIILGLQPIKPGSLSNAIRSALPDACSLLDISAQPERLQHKLSAEKANHTATKFLENTTTLRDAARVRSLQGKGAGSWISAIPTSGKFALSTCEYRLAAFWRLGLPLPSNDEIQACDCGKPMHDFGSYHQITCKTGGGPVWTHNSIMSVWSECLASLQIHHRKEPTGRYSTSESRPDISVFDTGAGSNVELDIALAHPWSSDIFPPSATIDGAAASRREDRKKARYGKETYPEGMSVQVIPLVLEHYGRWGKMQRAI